MKSIFITLQPGFEGMLSKESRNALLLAQNKLRTAWLAVGQQNVDAGRPRGALAERVSKGQPDILEVAFHLLGARDGENRTHKEFRKNRVMIDGFSTVQFFTSRPGRDDQYKLFWKARRDRERVAGGLPPPLKEPVNCDDLEMAADDAEGASATAKAKSTEADEALESATEMVDTAEVDLTTCRQCTGLSSCPLKDCDCCNALPFAVYCNPACGCKCGKKCRNHCNWLADPDNPDFDCALSGCSN